MRPLTMRSPRIGGPGSGPTYVSVKSSSGAVVRDTPFARATWTASSLASKPSSGAMADAHIAGRIIERSVRDRRIERCSAAVRDLAVLDPEEELACVEGRESARGEPRDRDDPPPHRLHHSRHRVNTPWVG